MGREHRDDDGRNRTELNHGEDPRFGLAAEEPLAAPPCIRSPLVRLADGPVDDVEVGDSNVFLKNLGVDDRRQHHADTLGCLGAQNDFHERAR